MLVLFFVMWGLLSLGLILCIVNLIQSNRRYMRLLKFLFENKKEIIQNINEYVEHEYDSEIIIKRENIAKIRDNWNVLSGEKFKKSLYYKESGASDGFSLVKFLVGTVKGKNVIIIKG